MSARVAGHALARMGKRAAAYVGDHSVQTRGGGAVLIAARYETPAGIARTMTRIYGRPTTRDRGEIAYWEIGGDDVTTSDDAEVQS